MGMQPGHSHGGAPHHPSPLALSEAIPGWQVPQQSVPQLCHSRVCHGSVSHTSCATAPSAISTHSVPLLPQSHCAIPELSPGCVRIDSVSSGKGGGGGGGREQLLAALQEQMEDAVSHGESPRPFLTLQMAPAAEEQTPYPAWRALAPEEKLLNSHSIPFRPAV